MDCDQRVKLDDVVEVAKERNKICKTDEIRITCKESNEFDVLGRDTPTN